MNKENFESLKRGLDDAIAFAAGDTTRGRIASGVDARVIRERAGMTQPQFAEVYHIPVGTLRDWEQGRRMPDAPARALLKIIAADHVAAAQALAREMAES